MIKKSKLYRLFFDCVLKYSMQVGFVSGFILGVIMLTGSGEIANKQDFFAPLLFAAIGTFFAPIITFPLILIAPAIYIFLLNRDKWKLSYLILISALFATLYSLFVPHLLLLLSLGGAYAGWRMFHAGNKIQINLETSHDKK